MELTTSSKLSLFFFSLGGILRMFDMVLGFVIRVSCIYTCEHFKPQLKKQEKGAKS